MYQAELEIRPRLSMFKSRTQYLMKKAKEKFIGMKKLRPSSSESSEVCTINLRPYLRNM